MSTKGSPAESNTPWFGVVPKHWQVVRNKTLFREIDDRSVNGDEELLTVSHITGITPRSQKDSVNMFEAESKAGYKCVEVDDLAINTMWAWMGALGFSKHRGIVSPAYNVYRLRKGGNTGYFGRLFENPNFTKEVVRFSTGIWESRLRLYPEGFFTIRSPMPPVADQCRIAEYLDGAVGKIDQLVTLRQRQMDLLQGQRAALIQEAVTRGLNPRAPLKDSGLPWLGQIPKHWVVKPVKYIFVSLDGKRIPLSGTDRQLMTKREYDYYGASGVIDRVDDYIFDETLILLGEDGANLLNRSTPLAFLATGKYWVNNHAHVLKPRRGLMEYLVHLLETVDFAPFVEGSAQPKLTLQKLMAVKIPEPPVNEQRQILDFIEELNAKNKKLLDAYTRQIELLAEYRTALIHECVTGQGEIAQSRVWVANKISTTTGVQESMTGQQSEPKAVVINAGQPTANIHFLRSVLGAEIIHRLHSEPTFGRVKLEKIIYLSEAYAGIDLEGHYLRAAAGPFDNRALRSVETQIQRQKWYKPVKGDKGTRYLPMEKAGAHHTYFEKYWTEQRPRFERIIELLQTLKTENCEMIATLFAVWKDRLVAKQPFTDDSLVDEVLTNWHPNKQKIARERWLKALQWMRGKDLIPSRQN